MTFNDLIANFPKLSNGERLFVATRMILDNMELTALEKAKMANIVIGAGAYNPNNDEASDVFSEVLILANEGKVSQLISLLKELPKVVTQIEKACFYIDGIEVEKGVWFQSNGRPDTWILGKHTHSGMPILGGDGWKRNLRGEYND
jgi:hypothetical protein